MQFYDFAEEHGCITVAWSRPMTGANPDLSYPLLIPSSNQLARCVVDFGLSVDFGAQECPINYRYDNGWGCKLAGLKPEFLQREASSSCHSSVVGAQFSV